MAKPYKVTIGKRLVNRLAAVLSRWDKGPASELTVIGRSSGERRRVMITPVDTDEAKYIVSPYGEPNWVRNLRANPRATLSRAGSTMRINAVEVGAEEAGPVLVKYYRANEKYVSPYMDVPGDKTVTDFTAVADRFPVFRADPVSTT